MKKRTIVSSALLLFAANAFAFRFEAGNNITISKPVYEDLYIAGRNIVINAPVYGDLIIAGGTIYLNDTVTNDILIAGGTVFFNGYVGDDIRCAGGDLHILKNVAGDVVLTGGTIQIDKNIMVGGLIIGGGEVTMDGIATYVKAGVGKFTLNGTVIRELDARGGLLTINGKVGGRTILSGSEKIVIGNNAEFGSEVRYWTRNKVDFKNSLKGGAAIFDPSLKMKYGKWYFLGFTAIWGLLWYLGMAFLMILIIEYLFRNTMKRAGNSFYDATLRSLLYGILFCIGIPILAVIAMVIMIGVPVGLILIVGYVLLLLLATVITAVVLANWANNLTERHYNFWRISLSAFGIFILLKLLTFTPVVGWMLMALLALISFGAILVNIKWRRNSLSPSLPSA